MTIAGNTVQSGEFSPPPLGASVGITNGILTLTNTIVSCAASQTNVSGTIQDGGHNLCSDNSANFSSPTSRGGVDPLLAPLADNGGLTPTMALLPNSPAIDAGDDSVSPAADQRGVTRPQGSASDIGAFELAPTLNLRRAATGNMTLEYAWLPGETNQIDASTELSEWISLGTRVTDINGMFEFEDPDSRGMPTRFYQVRPMSTPVGPDN